MPASLRVLRNERLLSLTFASILCRFVHEAAFAQEARSATVVRARGGARAGPWRAPGAARYRSGLRSIPGVVLLMSLRGG